MSVNITKLRKLLTESLFDPKKKTPMSVVVSMDNPTYCEMKAIELLHEITPQTAQANLKQAISLLGLSRALREEHGPEKT